MGNHINGEVYGSVTDVGWAMAFPYAAGRRHPVALYDGIKNLLLVPILLLVRHWRPHCPGLLLGHFIFWYGFLRLFVDGFRDYDSYWLGIGRGQYFNLLMAVVGGAMILIVRSRPVPQEVNEPRPSPPAHRGWLLWKAALFYSLVLFCLIIPGGWTRAILETFKTRADHAAWHWTWGRDQVPAIITLKTQLAAAYPEIQTHRRGLASSPYHLGGQPEKSAASRRTHPDRLL
jgi:phosphatidylglycerol:prolipoprotein diacylglycerol transferase